MWPPKSCCLKNLLATEHIYTLATTKERSAAVLKFKTTNGKIVSDSGLGVAGAVLPPSGMPANNNSECKRNNEKNLLWQRTERACLVIKIALQECSGYVVIFIKPFPLFSRDNMGVQGVGRGKDAGKKLKPNIHDVNAGGPCTRHPTSDAQLPPCVWGLLLWRMRTTGSWLRSLAGAAPESLRSHSVQFSCPRSLAAPVPSPAQTTRSRARCELNFTLCHLGL